jgi:transcriptional regulator with GAF, ATPase, and Fis domain
VRGAFTGAVADKPGKFELAHEGTIFLDEIGSMPLHLQMKLLRVLQGQEIERVGGTRQIKLNVRVISATNSDLESQVQQGQFREDLFYRLNVIPIHLPPLCERREDIPLLARHFLRKICDEMKRPLMTLTLAAVRALEGYHWPGNVREMENVIERSVALTDGEIIDRRDLPPQLSGGGERHDPLPVPAVCAAGINLAETIDTIERAMIRQALEMSGGIKSRAALLLGLNRTTLVEKIKRHGLPSETAEP